MLPIGQIHSGIKINLKNQVFEVISANHINLGRGQAKLDTKLKNLTTGATVDQTFSGNDQVEEVVISYQNAQFLYSEGGNGHLMDDKTYEQFSLPLSENQRRWLKEGSPIVLVICDGRAIGVKIPTKIELEVSYAEPAVKGNSANAPTKAATLSSGVTVQVPLFIKQGEIVIVNTETGSYVGRANG